MKIKKNTVKHLFYSLSLIILIPQVFAYGRTGVSPLDRGIEAIGRLFNIEVLRSNTFVQEGFLKFILFVVLFAVANMALKKTKIFDNKTAGIVSFAFSIIGVLLMPTEWLLATGGLITVVMSSIIFLGFFIGLGWVAMFVLRKKGEDDRSGWLKNLLGLALLFLLLFLLDEWALFVGLPMVMLIKESWIKKFFKPGAEKKW
ncbi:hypothetical protein AYK26_01110 [Euryarchaeota archaeon SM23-78]|nr:MAG: hypothetical protein AYK26_01110 [Euryarchaeota archaeon SM23-78]MBW3001227.1 hypothetical protein [Candidatus Woesearchaeota archaeon]